MPIKHSQPLMKPVDRHDHIRGHWDAPVTLVEYADFECPYSQKAYPMLRELMDEFGHRLRLVYRHFPRYGKHPHELHAAEMSEIAALEGLFWPMHDLLFENSDSLTDPELLTFARNMGLDMDLVVIACDQGLYAQDVLQDHRSGIESGVDSTPTFFINGARYEGDVTDKATLRKAIQDCLDR